MSIVEPQPGERELRPGGGRRLRRVFAVTLVAGVGLIVAMIAVAINTPLEARWTRLAGTLAVFSFGFLIFAVLRGFRAVTGDRVSTSAAERSAQLAHVGRAWGRGAAALVLLVGLGQWLLQDVDWAWLLGLLFATPAMLLGFLNDSVRRIGFMLFG
ncbi:hypothetical protein AB0M20_07595 [Actinoplanes sp. NPDC051633]|uniref:hypothetical protein n=1 Tax=Actinoplanes sp. NPDC051633 TaxID=3155670 RepID=UPI0034288176